MKLTDPLEERVIFDLREIVVVVSGVNMGCQLACNEFLRGPKGS